jgi:hypothetical protein
MPCHKLGLLSFLIDWVWSARRQDLTDSLYLTGCVSDVNAAKNAVVAADIIGEYSCCSLLGK